MRLIDADAYIEQYCNENCGHGFCDHPKCYDYTVNTLLEFPTIDQKQAELLYHYCTNCGAKMGG